MNMLLPGMEGEARSTDLSQWYSSPELALKMWAWAALKKQPRSVLEPAAGRGALLRPIVVTPHLCEAVTVIDIDPQNAEFLARNTRRMSVPRVTAYRADFLLHPVPTHGFDLVFMNPPYEGGLDVAFIRHGLKFAPRVVGVFRSAIVFGEARFEDLWQHVGITRGAWLVSRPCFGKGEKADGARSDFVVLELVARTEKLVRGLPFTAEWEWW